MRQAKGKRQKAEGKGRLLMLLLSLAFFPLPVTHYSLPITLPVFAQTASDRKVEADQLLQVGKQLFEKSQFKAALENLQQALSIYQQIQDRDGAAATLNQLGKVYEGLSNYDEMGKVYQTALTLAKQTGNRNQEGNALNGVGDIYLYKSEYVRAQEFYQQALGILRSVNDRSGETTSLNNLGCTYDALGQYLRALEYYQQALTITREIGGRKDEAITLNNIGGVYDNLGQYSRALEYYQQALAIIQQVGYRSGEGTMLNNIGLLYNKLGQYPKALEYYQQALAIAREIGRRSSEGNTLNNIGYVYISLGEYNRALEYYQQALTIAREVKNRASESRTLNNIGLVYNNLGQYNKALEYYQQALAIIKQIGDRPGESTMLNNIAYVHLSLGENLEGLESFQKALTIARQVGDRPAESRTLNNIGAVYSNLGQYARALEFYQQALVIIKQIGDRPSEASMLNNIGFIYVSLGQPAKALEYYQQALVIIQETGNRSVEGTMLNNIGLVYNNLGQYNKALEYYQQGLAILKQIGDRPGEGRTLNNIGYTYDHLGQYTRALEFYQQALIIARQVGDRLIEARALSNTGLVYNSLKQYPRALEFYQQGLTIARQIGDRPMEGTTLNNIGIALASQKRPELAIVFLKRSVSIWETIREELRQLPREQQQSYTETVASTYRDLADLLLQQDRILEAQQVLDLLKVQELENYLRNVRGNQQAGQVEILRPEADILKKYNALQQSAVQLGQELSQLREMPENQRSPQQKQRIAQLVQLETELNQQFNQFIDSPEVVSLVEQLSRTVRRQNVNLEDLNALRDDLRQHKAALLYPLILDDQLELILTTPDAAPIRRSVKVKREELNGAIAEFRAKLNPARNPKPVAQKLYQWLIQPLEADLKQANIQTIIYAPDSQLRYIPLAALHDGNQWLAQRYRINHITARSLTSFTTPTQSRRRLLAGAFVQGTYEFQVSQRQFSFSGLPFAGKEVEALAAIVPNTTKLVDQAFGRDAILPKLNEYSILHFATHAAFVSGQPDDSFILFGNGDRATLREIETWSLQNVDLVVLSACETGLGGKLGNGEEILGLGYQFQRAGARAAVASLWAVDDGGTQVLMNAFYAGLNQGMSKVQALQEAQKALITEDYAIVGGVRSGLAIVDSSTGQPRSISTNTLNHPYYWAPFILIGNGL